MPAFSLSPLLPIHFSPSPLPSPSASFAPLREISVFNLRRAGFLKMFAVFLFSLLALEHRIDSKRRPRLPREEHFAEAPAVAAGLRGVRIRRMVQMQLDQREF